MFDINTLTKENFGKYFECTWSHQCLLYWTKEDLEKGIANARKYNIRSYIGPNSFIPEAKRLLADTDIKIDGTWSYPGGNIPTKFKIQQLEYIMDLGANSCDGCLNMQNIKNHEFDLVEQEVKEIMTFARNKDPEVEIKMIVELGHLTDDEILTVGDILNRNKVDFYKMGTGWREVNGGITTRKIRMIRHAFPDLKIKGFGGDLSLASVIENLEAGTNVIGSSSIEKLLGEWEDYFRLRDAGAYK